MSTIFRIAKIALRVIGAIAVITAIVLGICAWQVTRPSGLEKNMQDVTYTQTDAASFDQRIDDLVGWLTNPSGPQYRLTLTEKEVSAKLKEATDEADIPIDITTVAVNFTKAGEVLIRCRVDIGLKLRIAMRIEMVIEDGKPKTKIEKLQIGRAWIPRQVKNAIANNIPIEDALTDMLKGLPMKVTSIEVEPGKLIFYVVKAAS
ncbi:MAG: hypothetical protein FJ012_02435 [Chloroflexi bacterium]|nr:hypothetical protein [Chloroflexota bacterium]